MKLIIGNRNYSSWSLRPWLLLSANNIPFEEVRISLFTDNTYRELAKYTAAGKVPVLHDDGLVVWDSLAICEYVSENYLNSKGWPADKKARAEARACAAEMHSGFLEIRGNMPMNCRAENRKVTITSAVEKEIARMQQIWSGMREKYAGKGPWLFGEFSIADCMFAPVMFRFRTYGVPVSGQAKQYMEQLLAHPKMQQWLEQGKLETEVIEASEVGR